ncbi:hypothetical protein ACFLQW_00420 [Candidatus Zixiibacteriota bacterium]
MKILLTIFFVCLLGIPAVGNAAERDTTLIDFKLKDQFDNEYRDDDWQGRIIVLFGYDRKGNEYQDQWLAALRDSLPPSGDSTAISFIRLANVRGVPFFLKGMLKGKFPQEPDQWVLLDWKGRFDKAYEFEDDACNILVFDRQGALVYRTPVTELNIGTLKQITTYIRSLLPPGHLEP